MEASAITARLETCYTAVVHDIMRKMGFRDFVLPSNLRPILPDQILAGPIHDFGESRSNGRPP